MTQPPHPGQTVGQGAPQSTEFGATTVSGTPRPAPPPLVTGTAAPTTSAPPRPTPAAANPPSPSSGLGSGPGAGTSTSGMGIGSTASRASGARGPRRARLQLRHINPWTVLKFSCVLSIALFFVWLIVVGVLYGVLDASGVINKVNDTVTTINGAGSKDPVTAGIVFGGAAIVGVINIVLFIALSTVGSVVYNLCADLVGGIEITLSER